MHQKESKQSVSQTERERIPIQNQTASATPAIPQWADLPAGGSASLRRASVLQMQRTAGNTAVMRQLAPSVQKQGDGEGAAPSEIQAGGNVVQVTSGGINITGPSVRVNAALADFSGVVRSQSLITDNVIASSYSPGAGNIW